MLNDKSNNVKKIGKDAEYNTPNVMKITEDAGYSTSKPYVCGNKNCDNHYIMLFTDSDNKVCEACRKTAERFTEKHLEPRPGELEALRKKYGIEKKGGKDDCR